MAPARSSFYYQPGPDKFPPLLYPFKFILSEKGTIPQLPYGMRGLGGYFFGMRTIGAWAFVVLLSARTRYISAVVVFFHVCTRLKPNPPSKRYRELRARTRHFRRKRNSVVRTFVVVLWVRSGIFAVVIGAPQVLPP